MSARQALFVFGLAVAVALSWLWPRIQQPPTTHEIARELLAFDRPDDALILFDEPVWRGIAEYRARRFKRALYEFFQSQSVLGLYNTATSHAQLGSWNGAIVAYEKVLRLDPSHVDARHNLELVLLAAKIDADKETPPPPNSAILPNQNTQQQEVGEELADSEMGNASESGGSETSDQNAEIDLNGTGGNPGELGDSQPLQRAGTSNITGDPEQSREGTLSDRPGSAEVKARESAQAAEILLRHIHDDPEKVLRVRLFTAHRNRQAGTP
jgi:tetratricopeptide (TPR) repeat protein